MSATDQHKPTSAGIRYPVADNVRPHIPQIYQPGHILHSWSESNEDDCVSSLVVVVLVVLLQPQAALVLTLRLLFLPISLSSGGPHSINSSQTCVSYFSLV